MRRSLDCALRRLGVVGVVALVACRGGSSGAVTPTPGDPRFSDPAASDSLGADGGSDAISPGDGDAPTGLPGALPFDYSRPEVGTPLSEEEITAFTRTITGLWRDLDYFRWLDAYSHGLDKAFDPLGRGFKLYWQDANAIRQGDTVEFRHFGGSDNQLIRTSKLLVDNASGYLMSGDPVMAGLVEQYANGIVAMLLGMAWGTDVPPLQTIMARAVFTYDHSYTTAWGHKVAVSYADVRHQVTNSKAETVMNPANPTWGEIWIRTQRSKDDLPYLYLADELLLRVAEESTDEPLRLACLRAHAYVVAFARDVVDHGYLIRARRDDGSIFVPDQDFASLVTYEWIMPGAECTKKLPTALVAYGAALGNDCGDGCSPADEVAVIGNWFNDRMIRHYHLASVTQSLLVGDDSAARTLLDGVALRAESLLSDSTTGESEPEFESYGAAFLVFAAAAGLPLTSAEARWVIDEYTKAAGYYPTIPQWFLWSETGIDGTYPYTIPNVVGDVGYVRAEDLPALLYYCYSHWRNPHGTRFIDCDVVADPARWGQ